MFHNVKHANKEGKESVTGWLKWKACRSVAIEFEMSPVTLTWVLFLFANSAVKKGIA